MKAYFLLVLITIFYLNVIGVISGCGQKGDLVPPQPPETLDENDKKQPKQKP